MWFPGRAAISIVSLMIFQFKYGVSVDVSDANFTEEVINAELPVVVFFWAEWCGPCRIVMPVLTGLENDGEGKYRIVKINTDENPTVPAEYKVTGIPTTLFFVNGDVVDTLIGAASRSMFENKLEKLA